MSKRWRSKERIIRALHAKVEELKAELAAARRRK